MKASTTNTSVVVLLESSSCGLMLEHSHLPFSAQFIVMGEGGSKGCRIRQIN